ncbi:hypothetical protein [Candidatus Acidianus copahuensis]|nr:hypothetical protein [Candidatus Acidianus copahuensis]
MEEVFKIITSLPQDYLLDYFNNPENITMEIPFFKSIKQTNENTYLVKVGWLISVETKVVKIRLKNRITYMMEHRDFPRIIAKLDHKIEPLFGKSEQTTVEITFYYKGPFESLARSEAKKIYKRIREKFDIIAKKIAKPEMQQEEISYISGMKTINSGLIGRDNMEMLIDKVIVESVDNDVEIIFSDGENVVKMVFSKGDLVYSAGSINSLKDSIKYIIKKKQ